MENVEVQFCWFDPDSCRDLQLPAYETPQSAGMDIAAAVERPLEIAPGAVALIPSGFGVALPEGYELQVRPRSGLAVKHGLTVVNAPGTIDADYRGEIKVGLINLGRETFTVNRGDRVAQLVLAPVRQAVFRVVDCLDATERGAGGFGHTGLR